MISQDTTQKMTHFLFMPTIPNPFGQSWVNFQVITDEKSGNEKISYIRDIPPQTPTGELKDYIAHLQFTLQTLSEISIEDPIIEFEMTEEDFFLSAHARCELNEPQKEAYLKLKEDELKKKEISKKLKIEAAIKLLQEENLLNISTGV